MPRRTAKPRRPRLRGGLTNESVEWPLAPGVGTSIDAYLAWQERVARGEPVAATRSTETETTTVRASFRPDPALLEEVEATRRRLHRGGGAPLGRRDALWLALVAAGKTHDAAAAKDKA